MSVIIISALLANSPFVIPPPPSASANGYESSGACQTQPSGDVVCYDNNGVAGGQRTATTDPDGLMIRPQVCSPTDASCTAGNVNIFGGQDTTTIAIDGADPSVSCAGDNDTVTVTVISNAGASTATVLTEGTEWTAAASVATTCASLASAVNALAGVSATCTSPDVLVSLDATTGQVTLAESTAGCTTVATGTTGAAVLTAGTRLQLRGASGTDTSAIWSAAANRIDIGNSSGSTVVVGTGITVASSATTAEGNLTVVGNLLTTDITEADLAVGSCTVNQLRIDTAGTKELCWCQATNTWYCWSATTVTGPSD